MVKVTHQDWLQTMLNVLVNPAHALWKAVEAKYITRAFIHKAEHPILDLGCGNGVVSLHLFNSKVDIAMDLSPQMVKEAKRTGAYEHYLVADARFLPFKDRSINSIISISVLEHVFNVDALLFEISRVLRKDGILVFTVPSDKFSEMLFFHVTMKKLGLSSVAKAYSIWANKTAEHIHCYSPMVWSKKISHVGLRPLEVRYFLSPCAVRIWDLLERVSSFSRKLLFVSGSYNRLSHGFHLYIPPRKNSLYHMFYLSLFKKILRKYYAAENHEYGGEVLVVATK